MLKHILEEFNKTFNEKCFMCCMDYNSEARIPMMLCSSQHYCCRSCTDKLFKDVEMSNCPQCQRYIKKDQVCRFRIIQEAKRLESIIKNKEVQVHQQIMAILKEKDQLNLQIKQKIKILNFENEKAVLEIEQINFQNCFYQNMLKIIQQHIALEQISNKKNKTIYSLQKIGDKYFKNNHKQEAIRIYQQIIEYDLIVDYKINGLGNKYNQIGNYDNKTFAEYEKQINFGKITQNPYDALSLCYSQKLEQSQSGRNWYKQMLIKSLDNYQLLLGLANLECISKNIKQAKKLYERVIALKPEFDKPNEALALIYCNQNDVQSSLKWAKSTLQKNPENMFANFILIQKHDQFSAEIKIEKLKQLSAKNPQFSMIPNAIGLLLKQTKNADLIQESLVWLTKAVEINSNYDLPHYYIGQYYYSKSNWNQAIKWYLQCYKINPKHLSTIYSLGLCRYILGNDQQALKWYNKCLQIFPNAGYAYHSIGLIYQNKGEYEQAIQSYTKAISINKQDSSYFSDIAYCYKQLKNYPLVISNYQAAINFKSSFIEPHQKLLQIYETMKDTEKQIQYLKKLTEINRNVPKYYQKLIQIYQQKCDYKQAIDWLQKLLTFQTQKQEQNYSKIACLFRKQTQKKIRQNKQINN